MVNNKTTAGGVAVNRNVGAGATMATITGRVGIEEANELQRRFDEVFKAGRPWVIIRLKNVDFICSAGMGTLLSAVGEARKRGGEVIFTDVSPKVRTIFEFLDIWDYITSAADKDAALEMVAAGKRMQTQRTAAPVTPSFIVDDLKAKLGEGIRLSKDGKVKDALAYFNAVIKADRNNITALVWKASVLERLSQFDEARRLYKKVTDIGRGDPRLLTYARNRREKLEQKLSVATDREKAFERLRTTVYALAEAPGRPPDFFTSERTADARKVSFLECYRTWDDGSFFGKPRSGHSYVGGGGYFVWIGGRGVVIDPGKNFVTHFAEAGRRLADVEAIVVTGAAWDRGADLEPLLAAFNRYNQAALGPVKKIEVLVSGAVYKKYYSWLSTFDEAFLKLTVLYPGHAYRVGDATLDVKLADAAGGGSVDALGLTFAAGGANFAYAAEVAGRDLDGLAALYRSARGNVFLAHVGEVAVGKGAAPGGTAGFAGVEAVGRLLSEVRPSVALLGKMLDVTDPIALSEAIARATGVRCLPVDVGLTVNLETSEVFTAAGLVPVSALTVYKGEDGRLHYTPVG
ncbi:MAG TPA: STAS domain-containing protein [bacterium]|nr:STAS domain-containing protein [bacterium]